MQKTLIAWLLLVTVVAAWCAVQQETYLPLAVQQETYLPLDASPENMTCVDAVKQYLDTADFKGNGSKVKQWDQVVVDYIGRLEDGTVFDTSVEPVAQACGKYTAWRDYSAGLPFAVWAWQMIAWFDKGVVDMKVWQTKTIKIPAVEAYGERDEANLVPVPKDSFSGADALQPGEQVMTSMGQSFVIYKVEEENIILDANPPLAGKDLIFDITIKSVN